MKITYEQVKQSPEVRLYIERADAALGALGYTEHSFPHVTRCAETAGQLLLELGYSAREAELARIAGLLHDIGNMINRADHAQSGALIAFELLREMGLAPEDLACVVTAIGHHDEKTAFPVNEVTAALILADKSDVRRSRVRSRGTIESDIHDRVNYAVKESILTVDAQEKTVTLSIQIDTGVCPVIEYFEIFLGRMLLCRSAAERLRLSFKLDINGVTLL